MQKIIVQHYLSNKYIVISRNLKINCKEKSLFCDIHKKEEFSENKVSEKSSIGWVKRNFWSF